VNWLPPHLLTLSPHLTIQGADKARDWYKKVFGCEELEKPFLCHITGKVMHAELKIGNSVFMFCEEWPGMNKSPATLGGTSATLFVYVEDCDKVFKKAIKEGATEKKPPTDEFWGDRTGKFIDPFGHAWNVCTHIEEVTEEETNKRAAKLFNKKGS